MSEAPERIWIERGDECPYFYPESELANAAPPLVEYRRADLAGLPEELVGRIRQQTTSFMVDQVADAVWRNRLLLDLLAWHEQQGGGE